MTKIIGISNKIPKNPINYSCFNITSYLNKLDIQSDIMRVKQVNACVNIIDYKIVKSDINNFTLLIYANLYIKAICIPTDSSKGLYTIYSNQYFMEFMNIPDDIAGSNTVKITPYITEINVSECMLDPGSITVDTNILIDVKGCNLKKPNETCKKINYIGISNTPLENPIYYNYFIIDDDLLIPDDKPPIEDILSLESKVEIIYHIINPVYDNDELIKYNLSASLKVNDSLLYIGNIPTQPVHMCDYTTCITNVSMDLPLNIDIDNVVVNSYIKDIWAINISDKIVSRHIALIISIEI